MSISIEELEPFSCDAAEKVRVANLPTRPNSTSLTGQRGLSANDLKKAYDQYPEALRNHLNTVIGQVNKNFSDIVGILLDLQKKAGEKTVGGGEIFNDYDNNEATGPNSSASGEGTIATEEGQCVVGRYNNPYTEYFKDALFVVGAGKSDTQRANALAVLKNGRIIGGAVDLEPTAGYDVVVKAYLDKRLSVVNTDIDGLKKEDRALGELIEDVGEIADAAKEEASLANSIATVASENASKSLEEARKASALAEGRSSTEVFDDEGWMNMFIHDHSLLPQTLPYTVPFDATQLAFSFNSENPINFNQAAPKLFIIRNGGLQEELSRSLDFRKDNRNFVVFHCDLKKGDVISSYEYKEGSEIKEVEEPLIKAMKQTYSYQDLQREAFSTHDIKVGTNFLLRALDVPDYWWDGFSAQPLETQKVDLYLYAQKSEVEQGLNLILAALETLESEVAS